MSSFMILSKIGLQSKHFYYPSFIKSPLLVIGNWSFDLGFWMARESGNTDYCTRHPKRIGRLPHYGRGSIAGRRERGKNEEELRP